MSEKKIEFEKVGVETLITTAPYALVFEHVRNTIVANGGKIKKEDVASGVLEGAWKYGISFFGLRVFVQFRSMPDNKIEINVRGGFVDSFDNGAGKKKGNEIIGLIIGETRSDVSVMPPEIGAINVQNRGKSKTLAAIMALTLGPIGLHKYYLGNWGVGLIFLALVFIFPIVPALVALVEGIRFIAMEDHYFNEKYNYKEIKPFDFIW